MKRSSRSTLLRSTLFLLLAFSLQPSAFASQLVTLTITQTSTPADGNTLVINGDTRTWKTTVANPLTQVLITSNVNTNNTNLYSHIAISGFTGPLVLQRTASNVITLRGQLDQVITASKT